MKIIVTGSEGLIGKSVVEYLANIKIYGGAEILKHKHEVFELDIKYEGVEIDGVDLNNEGQVIDAFSREHLEKTDALINCFALNNHWQPQSTGDRIMDISLDSFDAYLKTNVTALFSVCREFRRNNPKGSIVNFSSTYGLGSPRPDIYGNGEKHIAYGVSKAAVIQLTKHLATHWAPDMRVNCIVPGGVENGQSQDFIDAYSKHTPMGRMAKVEEICGLVEFLISDKASYCTGGVYPVDGGWTAW
jgi:NAD(P)-dependent dehydrogenase (short-subunit alcohol dehydrogenase family)